MDFILAEQTTYPPPTTSTPPPPTTTAGTGAPQGVTTGAQAVMGLTLIGVIALTAAWRLGSGRAKRLKESVTAK